MFSLGQALKMYDVVQQRIAAFDKEMIRKLVAMTPQERRKGSVPALKESSKANAIKKRYQEMQATTLKAKAKQTRAKIVASCEDSELV